MTNESLWKTLMSVIWYQDTTKLENQAGYKFFSWRIRYQHKTFHLLQFLGIPTFAEGGSSRLGQNPPKKKKIFSTAPQYPDSNALGSGKASLLFRCNGIFGTFPLRVADVEGAQERRSTRSQGLLRKEGPPTYAISSQKLVLSRITRFLKGFHRALNGGHPAFNFQQKLSYFRRAFNESHPALVELSTKAILLS